MQRNHLTGLEVLQSQDVDETRALVAGVFCDHRLSLTDRTSQLDYRHRYFRTPAMSFSVIRYGAGVRVAPQALESFFLIQLPLKGGDRIESAKESLLSQPGRGTIHCPGESFSMNWSADCAKLAVRIERDAMERHAAALLGRPLPQRLHFAAEMDTRKGSGLAWERTIRQLLRSVQQTPELVGHPLMQAQFEQLVMSGLLIWQCNTLSNCLGQPTANVQPRHLKLAEDYMRAHLDAPITNEELAALTGISLRTLYNSFRKFRGVSPMRYLRDLRMDKVREALLDADGIHNVTTVATQWGFFELGRFAAEYRRRYGESPSDTLRRRG
ncbi:AraC family transcriptional regulator [Zoogloea sp.]|uniref:AraC family transcriptional regulator n=1 Tax=Zoogloea sp. TaxID=49181 RepID=UPI0025E8805D|nr:AraC family transcriptional regulator [Zoogloea sp.]MCK6395412.1 AraC family transcriptional regulator [Zoogloea sp.]